MNLLVPSQVARGPESQATFGTNTGPLTCMDPPVDLQVVEPMCDILADVTLQRFGVTVTIQVTAGSKSTATVLTSIGLLPGVSPHVTGQMVRPGGGIKTSLAAISTRHAAQATYAPPRLASRSA